MNQTQVLDLAWCGLADCAVSSMGDGLASSGLAQLHLEYNSFTLRGALKLASGLAMNKALAKLFLDGTHIGASGCIELLKVRRPPCVTTTTQGQIH